MELRNNFVARAESNFVASAENNFVASVEHEVGLCPWVRSSTSSTQESWGCKFQKWQACRAESRKRPKMRASTVSLAETISCHLRPPEALSMSHLLSSHQAYLMSCRAISPHLISSYPASPHPKKEARKQTRPQESLRSIQAGDQGKEICKKGTVKKSTNEDPWRQTIWKSSVCAGIHGKR